MLLRAWLIFFVPLLRQQQQPQQQQQQPTQHRPQQQRHKYTDVWTRRRQLVVQVQGFILGIGLTCTRRRCCVNDTAGFLTTFDKSHFLTCMYSLQAFILLTTLLPGVTQRPVNDLNPQKASFVQTNINTRDLFEFFIVQLNLIEPLRASIVHTSHQ